MIFIFDGVENIVGIGENAGNQHFLLFPQCFENTSSPGRYKSGLCGKEFKDVVILPASLQIPANIQAVTEVISLGLATSVLPHTIAGASLKVNRYKGRFQGLIRPATPIGILMV